MKQPIIKAAALVLALTPSASYAKAFAAGEGSINWGTGRGAALSTFYLCDPMYGPAALFIPCGMSGRFEPVD